jgi:hypothetical protein
LVMKVDCFLNATFSEGDCFMKQNWIWGWSVLLQFRQPSISLNAYRPAQFVWNRQLLNQIVSVVLDLPIS